MMTAEWMSSKRQVSSITVALIFLHNCQIIELKINGN